MPLIKLIYSSVPVEPSFDALDRVLQTSRLNNARDHISGALLSGPDYFLQLLEGERAAVSACFMRIMLDSRHKDITLITTREVKSRLFADWSMHHIGPDVMRDRLLRRYAIGGAFDPVVLPERAISDLCKTLGGATWDTRMVA